MFDLVTQPPRGSEAATATLSAAPGIEGELANVHFGGRKASCIVVAPESVHKRQQPLDPIRPGGALRLPRRSPRSGQRFVAGSTQEE